MKIRTVVPAGSDTDHIREAMSLSPDPYLDLFELSLPAVSEGTKVYLSPRGRVVWAGKTFEGISCELTGANSNTTGEAVRPKFQVLNLAGLFSLYVAQRKLDNATLRRYRVLSQHLLNDQDVSLQYYWKVGKILNLTRSSVTLELRAFFDGPKFLLPIRQYFPPDFTHVDLG